MRRRVLSRVAVINSPLSPTVNEPPSIATIPGGTLVLKLFFTKNSVPSLSLYFQPVTLETPLSLDLLAQPAKVIAKDIVANLAMVLKFINR